MEVINIDNMCEQKQYMNKNPLAPQWPFRLLVVGPSGSGKSNLVLNLIVKDLHFDEIYIYAKDLSENKYEFISNFFRELESTVKKELKNVKGTGIKDVKIAHFSQSLNDIVKLNSLDPNKQTLIVFDDFVNEKDQDKIKDLFIRGRKRNASIIYISQSYFSTPKLVRLNSNYIVLFNVNNKREVLKISKTHATRIDTKEFMNIYKSIMKEPHSFMVIDCVTPHLEFHIRKQWDNLLNTNKISC